MFRQRRINREEAGKALELYHRIPIHLTEIDLETAIDVAHRRNTYAYDAYMIACALRHEAPLLSLDRRLNHAAREEGVQLWEVLE